MLFSDRNNAYLEWRKPEWECTLEVLNKDTDESLKRAKYSSVDHNRSLLSSISSNVFQIEIERKLEVELDGTHLPLTSDAVLHLKVDLWSIECAVALVYLIISFAVFLVKDSLKRSLCSVPKLRIAHEIVRSC